MEELVAKNRELEETLTQSALFGKQLLDDRSNLEEKLRLLKEARNKCLTQIADYKAKLEIQEQEKHVLNLRAEAAIHEANSVREELENLKERLALVTQDKQDDRSRELKLLQTIDRLKEELEEAATVARELDLKRKEEQERRTEDEQRQVLVRDTSTYDSTDNGHIHLLFQLEQAVEEKAKLQDELDEKDKRIFRCEEKFDQLHEEIVGLNIELTNKECQVSSYLSALENVRQENADFQLVIQQLQVVELDPSKRGNSLFGEVDDRRKRLEDGFKTLRSKYVDLCQTNEVNEGRIKNLQMQLAMQPSSSTQQMNASHVFQLEQSLALANSEIRKLLASSRVVREEMPPASSTCGQRQDGKDSLAIHTEQTDDRKEIDGLWLQLLSERDSSREIRKKLYACEKREEKVIAENRRLKIKLYERDNVQVENYDVNQFQEKRPIQPPSTSLLGPGLEKSCPPEMPKKKLGSLGKKQQTVKALDIKTTKLDVKDECKQQ